MFSKFSEEAQKVLLLSLKEKNKLFDQYIGTEHVLLAVLSFNNSMNKLLNNYKVSYKDFYEELIKDKGKCKNKDVSNDIFYSYTPIMNNILKNLINTKNKKNNVIGIYDLVVEIFNNGNSKALFVIKKMNVDIKGLYKELNSNNSHKKSSHKKSLLNELGVNLNKKSKESGELIFNREKEIDEIIAVLGCKNKSNPLLLGDAGVGKTAIVEEVARRINDGQVPFFLKGKVIYSIMMSALVAGTKYRGEFEEKITKLINEVEDDDSIILFIDEIHTLVGAGGADGAIDASNILKPHLARGNIKVIGATTNEEYQKYFAVDKALNRRFKVINVDEPSINDVNTILIGIKGGYEKYHHVLISDSVLKKIVEYADKFIKNKRFPDKAIDILDEACVLANLNDLNNNPLNLEIKLEKELSNYVLLRNESIINGSYEEAIKYSTQITNLQKEIGDIQKKRINCHKEVIVDNDIVLKVMENKTRIPFYSIRKDRNYFHKMFNNYLSESVFKKSVGRCFINYITNMYLDLINGNVIEPLYVWSDNINVLKLFIDEYSSNLFKKQDIERLDVSNYRNVDDLINNNQFFKKINNRSFGVIIIDNYESADYSVKDLFRQINKSAKYVDKNNEIIDFSHILFIYNIVSKSKVGFFNQESLEGVNGLTIDCNSISRVKLKNKVVKLSNEYNYSLENKAINGIIECLFNSMQSQNMGINLDAYIIKEIKQNRINTNKKRTMVR